MILTSDQLAEVVRAGGYRYEFVADVIVDGERRLSDSVLSGTQLNWNADQRVRGTGRTVITYSDPQGTSIVPTDVTSMFTPYATFLNLSMRVFIGAFSEKVLLGTFKVIGVTDPKDFRKPFMGRYISVGSSVGLRLADRFRVTDLERFPATFGPSDLSSAWDEIGRLTLLALSRNVPDAQITAAVTYQQNRLDAVIALAGLLGGSPYVDENDRVTIDPDDWAEPSESIVNALVSVAPTELTDDEIYNQVVIQSQDPSTQGAILATSELESGPLRYGGPFGRVPYFAVSQYVTTEAQAQAYADRTLPLVSQEPALQLNLTVLPDPRRQVGDVVPFDWSGTSYLGRVRELTIDDSAGMVLRVIARSLGPVLPPMELVYPALTLFPSLSLYPAEGISS